MPVRADYPVVLDACVLAESALTDLFLRLAEEPRLLLPKWTERIWVETTRTCIDKLGWRPETAQNRREAACKFFPEALIEGFEHLEERCGNHEGDRHVLAAAIHEKVKTIVTANLRHFPVEALEPWGIEAVHPGRYLVTLYEHDSAVVLDKVQCIAKDRNKSFEESLARLGWGAKEFADHVAQALAIKLPTLTPRD